MARNKEIARLPRNPKISAVLVWEKDRENELGKLVFSDIRYEPIIIKVDELKGTHQPLTRIVYYRDGQEVAFAILSKEFLPLDAQRVMGCIDVRADKIRSYHHAPDVFKMIFYKALAFVKSDNFGVKLQPGDAQTVAAEITLWAEEIYKAHGVNHDERAIFDLASCRLSPVRAGVDSLTVADLRRRFPVSYRQVIMTPGCLDGLDTHDTILYCLACKVSLDDIAFFVSLPKAKVKDIIKESRRVGKKPRTTGESGESKLYPTGTILVTSWSYERTTVAFWQVVRSTEKTLWVQQIRATATVNTPAYKELVPVMPPEPVDDTVYQCRINLRFGRNTPICIQNARAYVWDGTPEQASGDYF